jgi:hypothetical protein
LEDSLWRIRRILLRLSSNYPGNEIKPSKNIAMTIRDSLPQPGGEPVKVLIIGYPWRSGQGSGPPASLNLVSATDGKPFFGSLDVIIMTSSDPFPPANAFSAGIDALLHA